MVTLTLDDVEHIANLAKLELSEAEKQRFRTQLSAILEYAQSLQAVGTSDIPPTASVLPLRTVTRSDEVRPSLSREEALANAPDTANGCFRVLGILE